MGQRPHREACTEQEHTELRKSGGKRACKLQKHDTRARQDRVTRQCCQARGLACLSGGQRAQHVADGDGRNDDDNRDDAEDVAPPPHLSYVAGDCGTHQ